MNDVKECGCNLARFFFAARVNAWGSLCIVLVSSLLKAPGSYKAVVLLVGLVEKSAFYAWEKSCNS